MTEKKLGTNPLDVPVRRQGGEAAPKAQRVGVQAEVPALDAGMIRAANAGNREDTLYYDPQAERAGETDRARFIRQDGLLNVANAAPYGSEVTALLTTMKDWGPGDFKNSQGTADVLAEMRQKLEYLQTLSQEELVLVNPNEFTSTGGLRKAVKLVIQRVRESAKAATRYAVETQQREQEITLAKENMDRAISRMQNGSFTSEQAAGLITAIKIAVDNHNRLRGVKEPPLLGQPVEPGLYSGVNFTVPCQVEKRGLLGLGRRTETEHVPIQVVVIESPGNKFLKVLFRSPKENIQKAKLDEVAQHLF